MSPLATKVDLANSLAIDICPSQFIKHESPELGACIMKPKHRDLNYTNGDKMRKQLEIHIV